MHNKYLLNMKVKWLGMATFIVGAIVFILLFLAVYSMVKKKRENKGGCGCGCSGCPSNKSCESNIKLKKWLNKVN